MFPHVGRMDDIYGAYYLEAHGFKVVYGAPTVTQIRNPHDVTTDFEDEIHGYLNCAKIVSAVKDDPRRIEEHIPERTIVALHAYEAAADSIFG